MPGWLGRRSILGKLVGLPSDEYLIWISTHVYGVSMWPFSSIWGDNCIDGAMAKWEDELKAFGTL